MKSFNSSAAIVLSLGLLVSCVEEQRSSKSTKSGPQKIDVKSILASQDSNPAKAEKLALAAEQLLTPSGFVYADMILDQALALDAKNKRAGLYKSFLASSMATKGILARIKPLAAKDPKSKAKLEKIIAEMQEGSLKTFLLEGTPDIQNEKDVQGFADSIINGLGSLREFSKNNKNLDIKLNINDYLRAPRTSVSSHSYCDTYYSNGNYETYCTNYSDVESTSLPATVSLNRADMEALQHITAGYQIYTSVLNSYSASGAINVAKNAANRNKPASQVWKELIRDADFGKLRNDVFTKIPMLGSDAIIGVRWAVEMQKELCPEGTATTQSRPGMLFGNGICIKQSADTVESVLQLVELALQGSRLPVRLGINDTEVAPKALLDNPVKDLKVLKPVFNECNKVSAISDATLNGLFPHGDLNDSLAESSDCGQDGEIDEEEMAEEIPGDEN